MNVPLAMSTWNDIAVTYSNWHQVYHQSEEIYQDWRRTSMTAEVRHIAKETSLLVEALLRHELLAHLPEWLSRKGRSSRMHLFPNHSLHVLERDRFRTKMQPDLTWWMKLYTPFQRRCPPCIYAICIDGSRIAVTKLVVEVSAHIEPRYKSEKLLTTSS